MSASLGGPEPFDVDDTDGAARFAQATQAARALSELPASPEPAVDASPSSLAAPLEAGRVVALIGVMVVAWLGFMVWDTWL